MKRRDLFTQLPFTGYALAFNAADLMAQDSVRFAKPDFDPIAPPKNRPHSISHEPNMTLVELETDLFIAGGGLAGVCAALSAARHGARVVLVQDRSRLGGNTSSEVKMHVVGANYHKGRPGWREGGIIEELRLDDAANNPQRCWELWDLLLYDKVVSEPNITLLLETPLYAAVKKNGESSTSWRAATRASTSTASARRSLSMHRRFPPRRWKPAPRCAPDAKPRSEFNESLAPEKADEETLGSQHPLHLAGLRQADAVHAAEVGAQGDQGAALKFRKITSWEYGYWWIEWGGNLDTIRDNERIRFELLSIIMGVWDYIKNSGDHPESANWAHGLGRHDARQARQPPACRRPHAHPARPAPRQLRGRRRHRRLADGRSPARGIRPPGPAAEHRPPHTGGLQHPAALALLEERPEPDDGRPQHQRHARRVHLHPRHGHLRRDRPGRRHRRGALHRRKDLAAGTRPG